MKNVASLFTDEALRELKEQLDIELVDDKDYTDDELDELYCRITDEFPYEFDADGRSLPLGEIFESIIDVFCMNGLV